MRRSTGFTLIELMIAIAVLAILAAIALPSYSAYLVRGKLPDGTAALADYRVRMEQYYQDNRNYGGAACGIPLLSPDFFTLSCVLGAGGLTYTATAASRSGKGLGAAGDYTYTIDQNGTKATSKFAGGAGPANEWRTK